MRAWLERMWDHQVGLDEYLPGTPHKSRSLLDAFPYHVWGRSNLPSKADIDSGNVTAAEKKFREQDALRRRQFPSCFEEACAYGNLQAAVLMWSQGTVDIPTRKAIYEGNNASALMWAAFKGHLSIVRFLVDHGAPLNANNTLGHTALQWAITAGHTDVARYLLDHGADPSHRDRQGFDAAFAAVQNDRLAILLMLTEDASREGHLLQTSDHGTVFYQPTPEQKAQAANTMNPRTQKPYYLLDPAIRDVEGHTLMHWAAYRNSPATCQYLLDHWGYAVDAQDKHGRTPLVWAAREGFAEVMEVLLSHGADRGCADSDGWTALQYARTRNHPEAVYVLEKYPIASTPVLEEDSNTSGGGVFHDGEADVEQSGSHHTNVSESATAALLGGGGGGTTHSGGRYVCVRDRRAYGTFQMLCTHTIFAVMAICGPLYLAATFILMNVLPPVVSYFPFGIYFFKNVAWTSLTPRPTQSSRTGPPPSVTKIMGIASNIAESVRGTWLYRVRDPANLFVWVSFLFLQLWVWNRLGLPQLFVPDNGNVVSGGVPENSMWPPPLPRSAADTVTGQPVLHVVHFFGLSFFRLLTFQTNPLSAVDGYAANEAPATRMSAKQRADLESATIAYVAQSQTLVRWVLMCLFTATLLSAILCKLLERRSAMRASEEGTLRTSPLWRIVAARQYTWLHPRFFFQERHLQFPLRAFYCAERDVVVRGYDGYSNLLDSPIGQSNHLWFVLALTFFAVYEFLVMIWGLQQMRALLQCPAHVPWYTDAFFAFRSTESLERSLQSHVAVVASNTAAAVADDAATLVDNATLGALSSAVLSVAAPVISFAWLNTGMDVLLHGLPCRQYYRLNEITRDYLQAEAASNANGGTPSVLTSYVRRVLFLIQYYLWPTRASALGVWVLHYSFLASLALGSVALRQWIGVWRGATRLELANPLAQGSDGELVSIFPKDPQQAQRVPPLDPDDERYYAEVCPEKARPTDRLPEQGSHCIYADGNGVVNVVLFLMGRWGQRWRGAMAVSSHNAPVKTPLRM
jgi:ankyrin repeat protein